MLEPKVKSVGGYLYNISDVLGVGTWGTVYKAKNKTNSEQIVALKKMNKYKIESSQQSMKKYQSQVHSLIKSQHIQQVINILDFFKSKSHYYIVTQYYSESKDLYQYMLINKQKFCQQEIRHIWQDLLTGIDKLHKIGILHRDIKLQNIIYLYDKKQTKIIDFGMATIFQNPNQIAGSPMFMSPQVLGNKQYTYKCDIWSLGIVFYCTVLRVSPYGTVTASKGILQKMQQFKKGVKYPKDIYISEQCKQVIQSCLRYEQKDRFQIQKILDLQFFKQLKVPVQSPLSKKFLNFSF